MKQVLALIGALFAAVAASACCVLPAVLGAGALGTLGIGAALEPFRPALIGLAVLLLGAGCYFTYRPDKTLCDADGNCVGGNCVSRNKSGRPFHKLMLWFVAAATVAAMAFPHLAAWRVQTAIATPPIAAATPPKLLKTVVFTIEKMTCAACTPGIAVALRKTRGVQKAGVDFNTKQATVRYDAARVSVPQLRSAIERAGFPAQEKRP